MVSGLAVAHLAPLCFILASSYGGVGAVLGRAPGKCWKASANWVIAEERRVFLPRGAPGCLIRPL